MATAKNTVTNRPIACTFCGASVSGKVTPVQNQPTKEVENICRTFRNIGETFRNLDNEFGNIGKTL